MKISEAKSRCNRFDPIRRPDGSVVCQYLLTGDVCKLPSHFLCELKQANPERTTSCSRVQEWLRCQRAWAFHYFYNVKPKVKAKWKSLGSAFAVCRARIDSGLKWEIPADVDDVADRIKLEHVLREYTKLPQQAEQNEVRVITPLAPDLSLLGFADGVGGERIYEWKYTVDPDSYTRLSLQLQATSYFAGLPQAKEFVLCAAIKSKLKMQAATPVDQRKTKKDGGFYAGVRLADETPDEFRARISDSVRELFTFRTYYRNEFPVEENLNLYRRIVSDYERAINERVFVPNFSNCRDCDWASVCEDHYSIGSKPDCCEVCAAVAKKGGPNG